MSKSNLLSLLSVAALSLGLSIPAAAVTITVGGSAPAGSAGITFGAGNTATGGGVTSSSFTGGAATANTSTVNLALDPLPAGNTSYFAYTPQNPVGTITLNFTGGISDLSLLWGSPDGSNQITFSGPSGSVTVTATSAAGSGLVLNAQTSQFVNIALGGTYTSATFSSGINSFEFANVADVAAAAAASPEPASIALLAGGLLAIGAGAIRRRKTN
jgi:hypothetical protein